MRDTSSSTLEKEASLLLPSYQKSSEIVNFREVWHTQTLPPLDIQCFAQGNTVPNILRQMLNPAFHAKS